MKVDLDQIEKLATETEAARVQYWRLHAENVVGDEWTQARIAYNSTADQLRAELTPTGILELVSQARSAEALRLEVEQLRDGLRRYAKEHDEACTHALEALRSAAALRESLARAKGALERAKRIFAIINDSPDDPRVAAVEGMNGIQDALSSLGEAPPRPEGTECWAVVDKEGRVSRIVTKEKTAQAFVLALDNDGSDSEPHSIIPGTFVPTGSK